MEYIKSSNIDIDRGFFHFTRIDNRQSIQDNGLQAVAGGENPAGSDKYHKTIYFVKGVVGMLEAIDVWARWEYEEYVKHADHRINHGFEGYDKSVMLEVYEKMYMDFKDRFYYSVDFKEGKDGDFEYGDIDIKKATDSRDEQGKPFPNAMWKYGPYSHWGTPENPNNEQEIWNMNTKIGERTIPVDRLKIIETENGRTDALSIILEMYDKYRDKVKPERNWMFEILDNFIIYARERYKNDRDFADGMPDVGRREINLERQEELQRTNKVTPSSIAQTGIQGMQENPGQISEGMRRTDNIFGKLKENDNDKTLSE